MLHEHVITYCTARGIRSTFTGKIIDNNNWRGQNKTKAKSNFQKFDYGVP